MLHDFLPICREDMEKRGWEQCDFVYVIGDAYVDHPSFGPAIISRLLEEHPSSFSGRIPARSSGYRYILHPLPLP